MASIGDLRELQGEIQVEWKIKDFSSLSQEIDTLYYSPKFYFCGASWQIKICPNGGTQNKSDGYVGLFLIRTSTGSTAKINYLLSLNIGKEKICPDISGTNVEFPQKNYGWGCGKTILKSELLKMLTKQAVSDTVIVTCKVLNRESCNIAGSLLTRHQTLSDNLKEIYTKRKRTDCSLKVGGYSLPAHQMILEERSSVFGAMLRHDMKESQTGEISIEDMEKSAIESILMYMYTGDIDTPTTGNVFSLYSAAEKYDIKEVKEICSDFIIKNFSEDWLFDVIKFNELYQDENISDRTIDYFKENVHKIMKTEKWKTFAKENPDISIKLLSSILIVLVPEKDSSNLVT